MRNCPFLISGVLLSIGATSSHAQSSTEVVEKMLTAVCGSFQSSGGGNNFSIEGDASAQLSGLLKQLTDAGISGAAGFNSDSYVGVLRSEVGTQLNSVRECRERVWNDLSPLITSTSQPRGTKPALQNTVNVQQISAQITEKSQQCRMDPNTWPSVSGNWSGRVKNFEHLESHVECNQYYCVVKNTISFDRKRPSSDGYYNYRQHYSSQFALGDVKLAKEGRVLQFQCINGFCVNTVA